MTPDLRVHVFDKRTGVTLVRGSFAVIDKQLQEGELICLVADSEDGRRISLQIHASALEEVDAPQPAAPAPKEPIPWDAAERIVGRPL